MEQKSETIDRLVASYGKPWYRNGSKAIALTMLACGFALVALVSAFSYDRWIREREATSPLEPLSPRPIIDWKLNPDTGEGVASVLSTICNNSRQDLVVDLQVQWVAFDPGGLGVFVEKSFEDVTIPPGCDDQTFPDETPSEVAEIMSQQLADGMGGALWRIETVFVDKTNGGVVIGTTSVPFSLQDGVASYLAGEAISFPEE